MEDEPKIAHLVRDYLRRDGFEVVLEADGSRVAELVRALEPALVVLDLMLPGEGGLAVCRTLRRASSVPVIMLTARVDAEDRLEGFRAGADDYLCKPFNPPELLARVHAVLRRAGAAGDGAAPAAGASVSGGPDGTALVHGDLTLDVERFACTARGRPVRLTPVEFRMLRELLAHPGAALTRYRLMRAVYDDHRVVSDRTIDSHVSHLRAKLAEALDGEELVRSVYGVGYRIE